MTNPDCILDETCGIFPIRMRTAPLHPKRTYMDLELAKTAIGNAFETTVAYLKQLNTYYPLQSNDLKTLNSAKKVELQYGSSAFDSNYISNFPFSDAGVLNISPDGIYDGVKITGPGTIRVNPYNNNFVMYLHEDERDYIPESIVDEFGLKIEEVNDKMSRLYGDAYKVTQPNQKGEWDIDSGLTFATNMYGRILSLECAKLDVPELLATQVGKNEFYEFSKLMMPTEVQVKKGY